MNETLQNMKQSGCCDNGANVHGAFRPAADVVTSERGVMLRIDLPGAKESDIDVTIDKETLSIRAHVEPPQIGLQPLRTEYRVGDYERTFRISQEIDRDSIDATYRNGVLTVNLSRTKAAGPTKVKIAAG